MFFNFIFCYLLKDLTGGPVRSGFFRISPLTESLFFYPLPPPREEDLPPPELLVLELLLLVLVPELLTVPELLVEEDPEYVLVDLELEFEDLL